jgi:hypothetical protein
MCFETQDWDEVKVISPDQGGRIQIEKDDKWIYLAKVSEAIDSKS